MRITSLRGVSVALAAIVAVASFAFTSDAEARRVVRANVGAGDVVIETNARRLLYGLGSGQAIEYRVGVGREGKQWRGTARIVRKKKRPAWAPTAQIIRDKPGIARLIRGGSPSNPLGAAALVLNRGQYAIHGTNNPSSIGGFVSYGCIRMHNRDVLDLYSRVRWGTKVVVR